MDIIEVVVFLGIIGWGVFEGRSEKEKKGKGGKRVREGGGRGCFCVEEEIGEEVIGGGVGEGRKKGR